MRWHQVRRELTSLWHPFAWAHASARTKAQVNSLHTIVSPGPVEIRLCSHAYKRLRRGSRGARVPSATRPRVLRSAWTRNHANIHRVKMAHTHTKLSDVTWNNNRSTSALFSSRSRSVFETRRMSTTHVRARVEGGKLVGKPSESALDASVTFVVCLIPSVVASVSMTPRCTSHKAYA